MIDPDGIRQRYAALSSILDERGRRLLVAAEAKAAGYGGIAAVWRATGVATSTIGRGLRELAEAPALTAGRVRRAGGGRKPAVAADPDLMRDLKALVEPTARGDPEGPLRWTCKSLRRLADALQAQGHRISRTLVGELLHGLGFSLQANAKTHEGLSHPDRDAQPGFKWSSQHLERGGCDDPQQQAAKDPWLENTCRGSGPVPPIQSHRPCCDDHLNPPSSLHRCQGQSSAGGRRA